MDEPLGEAELLARMRAALGTVGGTDADLYVRRAHRGCARFSLNTLGQHAVTLEETAAARVALPGADGYHVATTSITDTSVDALVTALRRAKDVARAAPVLPGWPGFAAAEGATPSIERYSESTARCTPAARADALAPALEHARRHELTAAGLFETNAQEFAVANTQGLARYASATVAAFRVFAHDRDGNAGFAQQTHRDIRKLDVLGRAREACAKSLAGANPVALEAGEYDVLLEPTAVTELLEWMSFIAFGARDVYDGTSPLAERFGQRIIGNDVTLVDDGLDASDVGFGIPFDRDGVLRQRVVLIDGGVAREPVFDRLYAARMGKRSSGHASGMEDAPVAQNVQMVAGDSTMEQLSSRIKRGLHITRFHYVNGFLDPRRALMTGLTRDGTFLIENGERTRGVKNMRFTDSVLDAFGRIDGMTALRAAVPTWWAEAGAFVAPALLIRGFRFTGGGVAAP